VTKPTIGEDGKLRRWMVMPFYSGGDMCTFVETFFASGRIKMVSLELVRKWVYQSVCGVAYMHASNLAHRDISIENIFFDENDNAKVGDFGFTSFHKIVHGGCGKASSIAPEVFYEKDCDTNLCCPGYDAQLADVWALGVIMFTLYTGMNLYEYADVTEVGALRTVYMRGRPGLVDVLNWLGVRLPEDAIDLMAKMLTPSGQRPTLQQLLSTDPYLTSATKAASPRLCNGATANKRFDFVLHKSTRSIKKLSPIKERTRLSPTKGRMMEVRKQSTGKKKTRPLKPTTLNFWPSSSEPFFIRRKVIN